jgi:predicted RNase H-like nuclease (RuvC/YqgF family)
MCPPFPPPGIKQAVAHARDKEGTLENARGANDMMAAELKASHDEVARLREMCADMKDQAAHWQGLSVERERELDSLNKKVGEAQWWRHEMYTPLMAISQLCFLSCSQPQSAIRRGRCPPIYPHHNFSRFIQTWPHVMMW